MAANNRDRTKETKFNHFVAQFTSRPWLTGTNQFYKLSIDQSHVLVAPTGPSNWGGEEHLYSQHVEDAFGRIETRLAHLQRRLETASSLSEDERCGWAMWLLVSYLRTPAAFLCSANVTEGMRGFSVDLFRASYGVLASCVTNPHCIEIIANRTWQILTCEKPYFLKPDTGLVLTDRLDKEDCLILYPITPFSCFLATGNRRGFSRVSVHKKRVFGLNNHLLRWSEKSAACSTQFWNDQHVMLRHAVRKNLAAGRYSPPTSGRFFSIETVKCDGKIKATILSPNGPTIIVVPESAIQPVGGTTRPTIPGLYDVEDCPDVAFEVRYSDDEDEIDYASAACFMMDGGRKDLAVGLARKALQKDEKNLIAKLVVSSCEPGTNVGDLTPHSPDDAAVLAIWLARSKKSPLEGLKITSPWLQKHRDHERLAQANFLCAFMVYGARLFQALCGNRDKLPYLDDDTPLPDGVMEFVKRVCSYSNGGIVSEMQRQVGKMDIKASGLAADVLRLCGLNTTIRLYRKQE